MMTNIVLSQFAHKPFFSKQEFRSVVRTYNPSYSESSITWLLGKLHNRREIVRLGNGRYCTVQQAMGKQPYHYIASQALGDIMQTISKAYPLAGFQIWEMIQLNEFVNHQIAKNTIVVDVEESLLEEIFALIHDIYPYTLFCPSEEQYHRQRGPDATIIVQKLISESPKPFQVHMAPLEKILVDLLTNKLPGKLIRPGEYQNIWEGVFSKYLIKEKQLLRYAHRRNVMHTLQKYAVECNIKLEK